MNKEEFLLNCKDNNINIDEDKYNKLYIYYELLNEWNNKFNLTNILLEKDVFLLHFYDSLIFSKYIDLNNKKLCDFGTGAGFPGMVLALLNSSLEVTLIESNQKKCTFLNEIKEKLSLNNVNIVCDRVENYATNNREIFDIVTCRAVTSIPIIIELSTSLIKVDGILAPLKTDCKEEINKYKYLLKEFYLKLDKINEYKLPINNAIRMIPIFKKIKETDKKYPRNYSTIVKKYKSN